MAENDIYDSKGRYNKIKRTIESYLLPPKGKRKYRIQFTENIRYFHKLFVKMDARNGSYIRRLRLIQVLLIVCHYIKKDLEIVNRDDIDQLMIKVHRTQKTPSSKKCYIKSLKFIWKILFPQKDEYGYDEEKITPYVVRHLSSKIDKSALKIRQDRLSLDEFNRLIISFSDDVRMQALLTLTFESLGRPQELLGRKIKDIEIYDTYAKVTISEHGKEGPGILRCIDSYPYVSAWYNQHPLKNNPEAYFFINQGTRSKYRQLRPDSVGVLLRRRCERLGIKKPITLYSLKRNGVTYCRLRGDSDVDIQHRARWSSTEQLKTYDLSHQDDSFKLELIKRGMVDPDEQHKELAPRSKACIFCHTINGIAESLCSVCKRPLDRKIIEQQEHKKESENQELKAQMRQLQEQMAILVAREQKRASYDEILNSILCSPQFRPSRLEKLRTQSYR